TTSPRGAHHVFAEKTRCTAGPFLLCFTVICREEMAIDEVELEPLEFAEKMHTQQELQQQVKQKCFYSASFDASNLTVLKMLITSFWLLLQQLEMLVQILKHCSESQSVILETVCALCLPPLTETYTTKLLLSVYEQKKQWVMLILTLLSMQLQRQLESADLDTSLSIFTPEQIQGIVEKYSS
uniref:Uncharacterized protein n=2 Tax=Aegilops tauschii subsp. strangulata TaxID=200361 RepID=A0A453K5P1_AEGTS